MYRRTLNKFSKMKKIPLVGNLFLYYKYNKTTKVRLQKMEEDF